MAHACTHLMGLIYALELRYTQKLIYTFKVFQKLFGELVGVNKKTSKAHDLMVGLLDYGRYTYPLLKLTLVYFVSPVRVYIICNIVFTCLRLVLKTEKCLMHL